MTSQKAYNIIQFVSGYVPYIDHELFGIQFDNFFNYFNETTSKICHCSMRNVLITGCYPTVFDLKENFPINPSLFNKYLLSLQNTIQAKSDPDWFRCRFANVKIKVTPQYGYKSPPYIENRFVILARNQIYWLNSSGGIDHITFSKKNISIIEEAETEDEVFQCCPPLVNFFYQTHYALIDEYNEFIELKKYYDDLILFINQTQNS